jgi:hypothetical protein
MYESEKKYNDLEIGDTVKVTTRDRLEDLDKGITSLEMKLIQNTVVESIDPKDTVACDTVDFINVLLLSYSRRISRLFEVIDKL